MGAEWQLCPRCRTECQAAARFCRHCGMGLTGLTGLDRRPCRVCWTSLPVSTRVCINCGTAQTDLVNAPEASTPSPWLRPSAPPQPASPLMIEAPAPPLFDRPAASRIEPNQARGLVALLSGFGAACLLSVCLALVVVTIVLLLRHQTTAKEIGLPIAIGIGVVPIFVPAFWLRRQLGWRWAIGGLVAGPVAVGAYVARQRRGALSPRTHAPLRAFPSRRLVWITIGGMALSLTLTGFGDLMTVKSRENQANGESAAAVVTPTDVAIPDDLPYNPEEVERLLLDAPFVDGERPGTSEPEIESYECDAFGALTCISVEGEMGTILYEIFVDKDDAEWWALLGSDGERHLKGYPGYPAAYYLDGTFAGRYIAVGNVVVSGLADGEDLTEEGWQDADQPVKWAETLAISGVDHLIRVAGKPRASDEDIV